MMKKFKKKIPMILLITVLLLSLAGCGQTIYPDLPWDAITFQGGTFTDTEHDAAQYMTITWGDRTYMPYGTLKNRLRAGDVNDCLGFILRSDGADHQDRIYTLTDDPNHNFLLEHYVGGIMDQPTFWRAVDTRFEQIDLPRYIEPLSYDYWQKVE